METLLRELDLRGRRSAVAVTFRDLAPASVHAMVEHYQQRLQVPVVLVNARELAAGERRALLVAIEQARPPGARLLEHPVTAGGWWGSGIRPQLGSSTQQSAPCSQRCWPLVCLPDRCIWRGWQPPGCSRWWRES
ncbi:hypothetical protein [Verrucomicrobium spinosum]|uniref:hypothetical protein n=1 Tax=Verrucomicrobium spinosum TaxID=2736 RepID=UPI0012E0DAD3